MVTREHFGFKYSVCMIIEFYIIVLKVLKAYISNGAEEGNGDLIVSIVMPT